MALQNRVTPAGKIIATAARGTFMGNRGRLHDEHRRIVRTSRSDTWIICLLEFKGRRRTVMSPASYTELFFLDEAVALAAGHRPCAECRRGPYRSYLSSVGASGAVDLDRMLKQSRRAPWASASVEGLPDGVFVSMDDELRLIWDGRLHRWTPEGYVDAGAVADGATARVVTPSVSVEALRAGYAVEVHSSARGGGADS